MFGDGGGWFLLFGYMLLRLAVPVMLMVLLSQGLRRLLPDTP